MLSPVANNPRVFFVIDRSGSMGSIKTQAVQSVNRQLAELKKANIPYLVSVLTFNHRLKVHYADKPIAQVADLTDGEFICSGTTALNDAVLFAITKNNVHQDPVLVLVVTDGYENASMVNALALRDAIKTALASDRFTFAFSVPDNTSRNATLALGVPEGCIQLWTQDAKGVESMTAANSAGLSNYSQSIASGKKKVDVFYTNASHLSKKQVVQNLTDISANVKIWTVDKEYDVKSFIEDEKKIPFLLGALYYQLTKPEKVGAKKLLAVRKKGEKKVYAGPEARQLLGLPEGVDVKVMPGNHGDWDIFVQSTSINRKLVRGTVVLYDLSLKVALQPTWDHEAAEKAAIAKQEKIMVDPGADLVDRVWAAVRVGKRSVKEIMPVLQLKSRHQLGRLLLDLKKSGKLVYNGPKDGWAVAKK